jgi:hypothetical protein
MELDKVLKALCYGDERNPHNDINDEDPEEPRLEGCYCDNCFYGRDKFAVEILRLREELYGKSNSKNTNGK